MDIDRCSVTVCLERTCETWGKFVAKCTLLTFVLSLCGFGYICYSAMADMNGLFEWEPGAVYYDIDVSALRDHNCLQPTWIFCLNLTVSFI